MDTPHQMVVQPAVFRILNLTVISSSSLTLRLIILAKDGRLRDGHPTSSRKQVRLEVIVERGAHDHAQTCVVRKDLLFLRALIIVSDTRVFQVVVMCLVTRPSKLSFRLPCLTLPVQICRLWIEVKPRRGCLSPLAILYTMNRTSTNQYS
jgi:hypothetical protein